MIKNHKIVGNFILPDPGPQPDHEKRFKWKWRYVDDDPFTIRAKTKYMTLRDLVKQQNPEYNTIIVESDFCIYVIPDSEGGNKGQIYTVFDEE